MAAMAGRKTKKQQVSEEQTSRGAPGRYRSRNVLRMPGAGGTTVRSGERRVGVEDEEEEVTSEAQQQLKDLLHKQLDTSASSIEGLLERQRDFTPAATYEPLSKEVEGLRSLGQYRTGENDYGRIDRLRQMGLSLQEIELRLEEEGCMEPDPKRRNYGPDPKAHADRLRAIDEKIKGREKMLGDPITYAGVKQLSRHAMEVERSLFRDSSGSNQLHHLAVQESSRNRMAYPRRIMPPESKLAEASSSSEQRGSRSIPGTAAIASREEEEEEAETAAPVPPLPLEVIERNRLTVAEIRALPRFKDHTPGEPNKVLYIKNLHPKASEDDLQAVFGLFRQEGSEWPKIRLMTGRMRGQAFIEFDSIDGATKALQVVNGYLMKEKPLVICYGHNSLDKSYAYRRTTSLGST